ncbi:hypothetical protein GCM10010282_57460 [Streptomyces roseolus]|nr:hypothetical protein GCM10010282_57460 [Streptomyces roseolus]
MRRRHRDVPVCVTWTVPCAMGVLCPRLVPSTLNRIQDPIHEIRRNVSWIPYIGSWISYIGSDARDPAYGIPCDGSDIRDRGPDAPP